MSGECDKCSEHALECGCVLHTFDCECDVCKNKWEKAQADFDAIYTRVTIDMPFDIPKPSSIAKLKHNTKYLGWCPHISKKLNIKLECCDSCHEDEHNGYDSLGQIEFEDGYYDVCCKMKELALRHRPAS